MKSAPETICGFKVIQELGRGAMGTVYLGVQENLGRKLAIKVMTQEYADDQEFIARFRREGQIAARLRHPNIVQIYDFSIYDGTPYIAMEYLGSRTLKSHMHESGRLSVAESVRLTEQLLDALEHAHGLGIIHRDIKPANIMVTDSGQAALTDFSISYMVSASQLTQTGTALGTPEYMAPEQLDGRHHESSDLYSAAVILYEMVTGISPFRADTLAVVMKRQLFEMPDSPSAVDFTIPESLSRVILTALAKEPFERYQSAGEMKNALKDALRGLELSERVSPASSVHRSVLEEPPVVQELPPSPASAGQNSPSEAPPPPVFAADPDEPPTAPAGPAAPDWSAVQHVDSATMIGRTWGLKAMAQETAPLPAATGGDETFIGAPMLRMNPVLPSETLSERPPHAAEAPQLQHESPRQRSLFPRVAGGLILGTAIAFGVVSQGALTKKDPSPSPRPLAPPPPTQTPAASTKLEPSAAEGALRMVKVASKATVSVDGLPSRPLTEGQSLKLAAGDHTIKFSAPDRTSKTVQVTIPEGGQIEVASNLEWAVGNLTLKVEPPDATIKLDGKKIPASKAITSLKPGQHTITASRVDYETTTKSIYVTAGKTTPASVRLTIIPVPVQPDPGPAPGPAPVYIPPPPAPVPIYR